MVIGQGEKMIRLGLPALSLFCLLVPTLLEAKQGVPAPIQGAQSKAYIYKGKIVDEQGRPVSGIFPMTFKIYPGLKAKKPLWSEFSWVAVDGGVYEVELGRKRPLPEREDMDKLVFVVEIRGVGEVVREPFMAQPAPERHQSHTKGGVQYADSAGYAVEAEHAKNADRLQNLTLEEVLQKVGEVAGRGLKVGKARKYGNRIGGPGGSSEYNEICPPGTIMVGIKGAAGIYIDSIQIVCAPLE